MGISINGASPIGWFMENPSIAAIGELRLGRGGGGAGEMMQHGGKWWKP